MRLATEVAPEEVRRKEADVEKQIKDIEGREASGKRLSARDEQMIALKRQEADRVRTEKQEGERNLAVTRAEIQKLEREIQDAESEKARSGRDSTSAFGRRAALERTIKNTEVELSKARTEMDRINREIQVLG